MPGIFAGGEGDKLVAIFRSHARIIEGQRLALGNILIKSLGALRMDKEDGDAWQNDFDRKYHRAGR